MKCKAKKGFFFVRECGAETSVTCRGCGFPVCKKHLKGSFCKECAHSSADPFHDDHHHHHDNNQDYNRHDEEEFAAASTASDTISNDSDDTDFFDS